MSLGAQAQSSVVLVRDASMEAIKTDLQPKARARAESMLKGTDGTAGFWFSYLDLFYVAGTSQGYFYTITSDSTVKNSTGSASNGVFGMGYSFDPTSGAYDSSNGDLRNLEYVPDFKVRKSNPYTIDSFYVQMDYLRNNPSASVVDTLMVDFVRTAPANPLAFKLQYAASAAGAKINPGDSIIRFADATYDPARNRLSDSIPATYRYRYTKLLNAAFYADSNANGVYEVQFPMNFSVDSNEKVVAYVSFHSGATYPVGTAIANANSMKLYAYVPFGANTYVTQYGQDYTSFLWATKQSKYAPPYSPYNYQGHRVLIPSAAYTDPTPYGIPLMQFHVKCPTCKTATGGTTPGGGGGGVGVSNVNAGISEIAAVPNPASDRLAISFTLGTSSDVSVSLSNTIGQVVATQKAGRIAAGQRGNVEFSTSQLANGVYFFTVEANGQRTTNRVVVAH